MEVEQMNDDTINPEIISNAINSDIAHCIIPRNNRVLMTLSCPLIYQQEDIIAAINTALKEQFPTYKIIMIFDNLIDIEKENDKAIYEVAFIKIPKILIDKFSEAGIKILNIYVGLFENEDEQKYEIVSTVPSEVELATRNREGILLPYHTTISLKS